MDLKRMYITPAQVADAYQIPYSTLAEWRYKGVGPHYHKLGSKILYEIKAVDEFMEQNRVRTQTQMPSY
jgi:predicted site-specific integrase-resolvase